TRGRAVPAQLAMAVLAVGQAQLHDFEVVGAVDLPGGHGIVVTSRHALTIVASANTDRAIGVQSAHGHAGTAVSKRNIISTTHSGTGITIGTAIITRAVHQDSLEAGQI